MTLLTSKCLKCLEKRKKKKFKRSTYPNVKSVHKLKNQAGKSIWSWNYSTQGDLMRDLHPAWVQRTPKSVAASLLISYFTDISIPCVCSWGRAGCRGGHLHSLKSLWRWWIVKWYLKVRTVQTEFRKHVVAQTGRFKQPVFTGKKWMHMCESCKNKLNYGLLCTSRSSEISSHPSICTWLWFSFCHLP